MRPADVLNAHADLVHRFDNPDWVQILVGSLANQYGHDFENETPATSAAMRDRVQAIFKALRTHAQRAYAFQVTPEMVQVVQWAAATMEDLEPANLGIVPTPYGFVRFDDPLRVSDRRGREMLVNWLVWGPVQGSVSGERTPGIHYAAFNDMIDTPDEVTKAILEEEERELSPERLRAVIGWMGRWAFVHYGGLFKDQQLGPALTGGDAWSQPGDLPATNLDRLVYAMWVVLGQTIVVSTPTHPDRATAKRMKRMNLPPTVSVITLRKKKHPSDEGVDEQHGNVDWQHRWIVRGHPRWQACGPGRSEHKLIWISDFVKGPEDKPLKVSEKVYRLSR